MKDIDPEGVQERRSRRLRRRAYVSYGPNFCWHVDGRCKFGYKSHYSSGQFSPQLFRICCIKQFKIAATFNIAGDII